MTLVLRGFDSRPSPMKHWILAFLILVGVWFVIAVVIAAIAEGVERWLR